MRIFLTCLYCLIAVNSSNSQSISPSFRKIKISPFAVVGGITNNQNFLPFRSKDELSQAYNGELSKLTGLTGASIRPSFDGSKTNSILVELLSAVPWNICRIGVSTSLVQSDLKDSTKTAQEVAFQKLTNGGGNIIITASRPIYVKSNLTKGGGWFLVNLDIAGYFDINQINQDVYNPGSGLLINPAFDLRLVNTNDGNGIRLGVLGRYQFQAINKKYQSTNMIDSRFNNLGIGSIGMYLGGGNVQYPIQS